MNTADDLQPLFQFLGMSPLDEKSTWDKYVGKPFARGDELGQKSLRLLLGDSTLRRTKTVLEATLPSMTVITRFLEMDKEQRGDYDALLNATRVGFAEDKSDKTLALLAGITYLTQICVSRTLVDPQLRSRARMSFEGGAKEAETESTGFQNSKAVGAFWDEDDNELNAEEMSEEEEGEEGEGDLEVSPKIAVVLQDFLEARQVDPGVKAVVFSRFRKCLEETKRAMDQSGVSCDILHGDLTRTQRTKMLEDFKSPSGPAVLIVSFKVGGVGLTLTAASRCYMMEQWWNAAGDQQAQSRVHRIGQERPVTIVRLVMKDSIEERILDMQERKTGLFQAAFVNLSKTEQKKLKADEIRKLVS
mmetsp:Transcript_29628/g.69017  ORF Transcript_29628/g.69017 Transcript_29628/m.69017 type:complete len:360 (-) Transcript_29628:76-1155(-)